ncbi:MAG: hypothetical protein PHP46_01550 [Candidatus Omnitrophica bacterium]|nr:hypothetical protein [Candidatus Omnitrophota bacterium]
MKIRGKPAKVFKIRNRKGYAAICCNNITEGRSSAMACARMEKALLRKPKRG